MTSIPGTGVIKKRFHVPIQRAHFLHRVHGVVGCAEFPKACGAHELEKPQAGLSVCLTFKFRIGFRQNFMSRILDRPIALNVGINQAVQIGCVALELFQVSVRFIASKGGR